MLLKIKIRCAGAGLTDNQALEINVKDDTILYPMMEKYCTV
jgi:hypothetical protein